MRDYTSDDASQLYGFGANIRNATISPRKRAAGFMALLAAAMSTALIALFMLTVLSNPEVAGLALGTIAG